MEGQNYWREGLGFSNHGRRKHYKRGGVQVLRGSLTNFLKSVRDCFGEPRVAAE